MATDKTGRPISKSNQAEMDRMNRENAEAARAATGTNTGRGIVSRTRRSI